MSIELITVLLFSSMLVLLALGLPLAFALGGTGVIFIMFLWGPVALLNAPVTVVGQMRTFV